jgi:predicted enzyme related to lactoylglutathione lyase
MTDFCRFDLRTTDADAARAFYANILGHDRATIWPLHEQARARGARPHWLGHLGTADVEATATAFVKRGAMRLGPTVATPDGGQFAVLRDPGGAVVAVATSRGATPETRADGNVSPARHGAADVVWHVLNTNDAARAMDNYRALFGWEPTDRFEHREHGVLQQFAWHAGGASVGTIADIAGRPGVHPHWLFFFEVDALDSAMAATRAAGGLVVDAIVLPGGDPGCVCDDPQGAAFALRAGSTRTRRAP